MFTLIYLYMYIYIVWYLFISPAVPKGFFFLIFYLRPLTPAPSTMAWVVWHGEREGVAEFVAAHWIGCLKTVPWHGLRLKREPRSRPGYISEVSSEFLGAKKETNIIHIYIYIQKYVGIIQTKNLRLKCLDWNQNLDEYILIRFLEWDFLQVGWVFCNLTGLRLSHRSMHRQIQNRVLSVCYLQGSL